MEFAIHSKDNNDDHVIDAGRCKRAGGGGDRLCVVSDVRSRFPGPRMKTLL